MLLVRVFAFLLVLVLVLGAAVAVQNQALLMPRLAFLERPAAGRAEFQTAAADCTYLGLKGLQQVARRGPSCSILMEGSGQDQAFWNRAEASVRARTKTASDSDGY